MEEARASVEIAERIRVLRGRVTVSQQKLADYAGLAKKTIERIEGGTENPSMFVLIQIATALGTTAADLLTGLSADDLPATRRPHAVGDVRRDRERDRDRDRERGRSASGPA